MDRRSPEPLTDLILTGHFIEGPGYGMTRQRGSGDVLILYTVAGAGVVSGRRTGAGELIAYRAGTRQAYGTDPEAGKVGGWELLWAHVHPRPHWVPGVLEWPVESEGVMRVSLSGGLAREVEGELRRMHAWASGGGVNGRELAMAALEVALLLAASVRPRSRRDPRVEEAARVMAARPEAEHDWDAIAAEVGLSGSRLAHLFSEQVGVTPLAYLEGCRMDKARRLLSASALSVKEVAAACGYESQFYFSTRFKKATGRSPSEYRSGG